MTLAILLSTCDPYAPMARVTARRLDACWPDHPEVFVCGLSRAADAGGTALPLVDDPRDWVGIALSAVRDLEKRGVEWLYLVLDDHPPFGPCNADYLNRRLPETAARLGAVQVNLVGWDQYQPQAGVVLGPDQLHWQRNDPSFRWKFSLHPGFWRVLPFRAMLESLREHAPDVRSARQCEGAMHAAAERLDPALLGCTYRVRGDGFTARRRWFESRPSRIVTRQIVRVSARAARLGGPRVAAAFASGLLPYHRYLNGPYPMFWSGLLRQGRPHEDALRFLRWTGQSRLVDEIGSSLGRP